MSGLGDSTGNITYLGTFQGKFTLRTTKEEALKDKSRGVIRINKNGAETCELHYSTFTGFLTKIGTKKDDQYGLQFAYQFVAGGETYEIKFSAKSKQADAINKVLPNLNLSEEFTLRVFPKEEEYAGKKQITTVLYVTQGIDESGKPITVPRFWTKDNPRELPQAVQKEWEGEMRWDFGAQRKYLMQYIADNIIPKLPKFDDVASLTTAQQHEPETEEDDFIKTSGEVPSQEEDDDLPF